MKITERGWPGHSTFLARCEFHRNTLIEHNDLKIIVSTVGRFRPKFNDPIELLGDTRYYETLVFHGRLDNGYIDIDINRQILIPRNLKWHIDHLGITSNQEANNMHDDIKRYCIKQVFLGEIQECESY